MREAANRTTILIVAIIVLEPTGFAIAADRSTAENLGATTSWWPGVFSGHRGPNLTEEWFLYSQQESFVDRDLNGDGDRTDSVLHLRHRESGEVANLGVAGTGRSWTDEREFRGFLGEIEKQRWRVVMGIEEAQGEDLDGDGDAEDVVFLSLDLATRRLHLLDGFPGTARIHLTHRDWVVYQYREDLVRDAIDVNVDGDLDDWVIESRNLETGEATRLAVIPWGSFVPLALFENRLIFILETHVCFGGIHTFEFSTGVVTDLDLNADFDFFEGCNPVAEIEGSQLVFPATPVGQETEFTHVYDLATGDLRNLGLTARYPEYRHGQWILPVKEAEQGEDLDGDGTVDDTITHLFDPRTGDTLNLGGTLFASAADRWVIAVPETARGDLDGDGDTDDDVLELFDARLGARRNLGLAVQPEDSIQLRGRRLTVPLDETREDRDLNADGDLEDRVVHIYDIETGELENPGLATQRHWLFRDSLIIEVPAGPVRERDWYYLHLDLISRVESRYQLEERPNDLSQYPLFRAIESGRSGDLNGDGDTDDTVLHELDPVSGSIRNLGLAARPGELFSDEYPLRRTWIPLEVSEAAQGEDLNEDGDLEDLILHVHWPGTDETVNLGFPGRLSLGTENWLTAEVYEREIDQDLDGSGFIGEIVLFLVDLGDSIPVRTFLRGDGTGDGVLDIADPIASLGYQFAGTFEPACLDALDFDDNGIIDLSDPVANLTHQFLGGDPPAPPGLICGSDTTADALACLDSGICP